MKKDIIEYCLTFPAAYEDYPFDANWAVIRHKTNKKSFAFIYELHGKLCVNLKCAPNEADLLRSREFSSSAKSRIQIKPLK